MFKKIRRAFIKLCNKRSIDVLDMKIRECEMIGELFYTIGLKQLLKDQDLYRLDMDIYYKCLHEIEALQDCKRLIIGEELEL